MPGVRIGDGAIIAAGAVVTSDIAPYTIVGGNSATSIKKRFAAADIDRLLRAAWWNYSWDAHLADLDAVITALGLHHPYLVGHSLGEMIAIRHTATRPEVVNLDGFGGDTPHLYPSLPAEEATQCQAEQMTLFSAPARPTYLNTTQARELIHSARATAAAQSWHPEGEEANTRRCLALLADGKYARRPAPHTLPALMAQLEGGDMFAELRHLTCPALITKEAAASPSIICPQTSGN
jgi:pimeloyl-ACP methyl ester carboxylesterase